MSVVPLFATWVLSFAGAALSLVAAARIFKVDIRADKYLDVLERLLREGEQEKARKLCRISESPVMRTARAALELRLERTAFTVGSEGTFRQAPETIPFEERARQAVGEIGRSELIPLRRAERAALIGAVLCTVSLWPPWPRLPTMAAAIGLVLAIWALRGGRRVRKNVAIAVERLPALVRPVDSLDRD